MKVAPLPPLQAMKASTLPSRMATMPAVLAIRSSASWKAWCTSGSCSTSRTPARIARISRSCCCPAPVSRMKLADEYCLHRRSSRSASAASLSAASMITSAGASAGSRSSASRRLARMAPTFRGGTRAAPCEAISACSWLSRLISKAFIANPCGRTLAIFTACRPDADGRPQGWRSASRAHAGRRAMHRRRGAAFRLAERALVALLRRARRGRPCRHRIGVAHRGRLRHLRGQRWP